MQVDEKDLFFLWTALLLLAEEAVRDGLTGLYNRRYFDAALAERLAVARRYDRPLALAFFDLDGLKAVNDACGHAAGDERLRAFAEVLRREARAADTLCRYGGDEFAVILPETDAAGARRMAERVCRAAETAGCPVCAGTAALPCDDLLAEADRAMRAEKRRRGAAHGDSARG